MTETPAVLVLVSSELLAQLGEWSPPVQVRVVKTAHYPGWEMESRSAAHHNVVVTDWEAP